MTKMMTDALIKAGRPNMSCAGACYVGRYYSSAFVVASVLDVVLFVVAYPTVWISKQTATFALYSINKWVFYNRGGECFLRGTH